MARQAGPDYRHRRARRNTGRPGAGAGRRFQQDVRSALGGRSTAGSQRQPRRRVRRQGTGRRLHDPRLPARTVRSESAPAARDELRSEPGPDPDHPACGRAFAAGGSSLSAGGESQGTGRLGAIQRQGQFRLTGNRLDQPARHGTAALEVSVRGKPHSLQGQCHRGDRSPCRACVGGVRQRHPGDAQYKSRQAARHRSGGEKAAGGRTRDRYAR